MMRLTDKEKRQLLKLLSNASVADPEAAKLFAKIEADLLKRGKSHRFWEDE